MVVATRTQGTLLRVIRTTRLALGRSGAPLLRELSSTKVRTPLTAVVEVLRLVGAGTSTGLTLARPVS